MTTYLLDVNVLLALSDTVHTHHEAAHRWFSTTGNTSWATCPLTENGFVRIASHPRYPNRPGDAATVLDLLRQFCALEGHQFWPEDISLRNPPLLLNSGITHNNITDVYLLSLAVSHQGKLATFDRHIPTIVVESGETALELISV